MSEEKTFVIAHVPFFMGLCLGLWSYVFGLGSLKCSNNDYERIKTQLHAKAKDLRPKPKSSLPTFAVANHDVDILQQIDMAQHIAAHCNDVGVLAFTHSSHLV